FCVFGSYAKETQRKGSDLDVFVVGKYDSNKIKNIAKNYGYDVHVFGMSVRDFKKSITNKTVLIQEIIENHVILNGADNFLESVLNG
ncbi:MAG: nucleotidyltransferase domain-containing protein, partial [Nanoarchaeota archaeon]